MERRQMDLSGRGDRVVCARVEREGQVCGTGEGELRKMEGEGVQSARIMK